MNLTKNSDDIDKQVRAWLQFAIDLEERGLKFYKKCRSETHHPRAMELFDFLIRVETAHKKILTDVLEARTGGDKELIHQAVHDFMKMDIHHPLFDEDSLKKMTDRETALHDVFNTALEFEKEGLEFYRKLEKENMDAELKKLFKRLADDEKEHFKEIKLLGEFVFSGPVADM